ncbi:hypothetical protein COX03_01555 [Candidatus Woesebacteria bacterium CG22_combo_CG10-13_8_21_14_all_39_10]|uniref:Aspartate racemase n=2 Tax=Candidatus Woeseibacteriota TaxID=1752722 RepID=A0A2H0BJ87_9BACT|nr:MAG: hypothetical protein COX03_01555 [Candidatus Woesebacteria bacterium CG22_combo_CG10-13_8_21_14_all_39_10]PIZ47547.1 MAG: hypothetical protein COY29_05060 [Candidatus Woesebacteria bacterium CG_4_10_14_0_2_um_filter_39_14]
MNMNKKNIIGLIGGMGPYASAYFYKLLIIKSTKEYGAKNNDDYPEIVIDSVPVPDFISDTKQLPDAKRMLLSRVRALNNFGCNIIAMTCNTGHLLYQDLVDSSHAPFISLVELVCRKAKTSGMKKVGLLATETTVKTQLYHKILKREGIEVITPDKNLLKKQENIIRYVIANGETKKFEAVLSDMVSGFIKDNDLDGVILGCTELPLVFPNGKFECVIDSLDVLADYLLKNFYYSK